MPIHYRAYGLGLHSDDAIPGLQPCTLVAPPDVVANFLGDRPLPDDVAAFTVHHRSSEERDNQGRPLLVVLRSENGAHYSFDYADGTQFLIADRGSRVWARWPAPLTREDTATYFLGPILGFVLRLKQRVCLHSSSIVVGEGAVAFTGPSGAGKSTLVAALVSRGYRALTEDVLPVHLHADRVWVEPGPPLIRLWQSSVRSLFGAPDAMPLLTPNWEKRFRPLSVVEGSFMPDACPLRLIYLLVRQTGISDTRIRAVPARDALLELVRNTYSNQLLDAAMRAEEFTMLGRLLEIVQVRELRFGDDFDLLPQVIADVMQDIAALERQTLGV
jgi:hypothetical protein